MHVMTAVTLQHPSQFQFILNPDIPKGRTLYIFTMGRDTSSFKTLGYVSKESPAFIIMEIGM